MIQIQAAKAASIASNKPVFWEPPTTKEEKTSRVKALQNQIQANRRLIVKAEDKLSPWRQWVLHHNHEAGLFGIVARLLLKIFWSLREQVNAIEASQRYQQILVEFHGRLLTWKLNPKGDENKETLNRLNQLQQRMAPFFLDSSSLHLQKSAPLCDSDSLKKMPSNLKSTSLESAAPLPSSASPKPVSSKLASPKPASSKQTSPKPAHEEMTASHASTASTKHDPAHNPAYNPGLSKSAAELKASSPKSSPSIGAKLSVSQASSRVTVAPSIDVHSFKSPSRASHSHENQSKETPSHKSGLEAQPSDRHGVAAQSQMDQSFIILEGVELGDETGEKSAEKLSDQPILPPAHGSHAEASPVPSHLTEELLSLGDSDSDEGDTGIQPLQPSAPLYPSQLPSQQPPFRGDAVESSLLSSQVIIDESYDLVAAPSKKGGGSQVGESPEFSVKLAPDVVFLSPLPQDKYKLLQAPLKGSPGVWQGGTQDGSEIEASQSGDTEASFVEVSPPLNPTPLQQASSEFTSSKLDLESLSSQGDGEKASQMASSKQISLSLPLNPQSLEKLDSSLKKLQESLNQAKKHVDETVAAGKGGMSNQTALEIMQDVCGGQAAWESMPIISFEELSQPQLASSLPAVCRGMVKGKHFFLVRFVDSESGLMQSEIVHQVQPNKPYWSFTFRALCKEEDGISAIKLSQVAVMPLLRLSRLIVGGSVDFEKAGHIKTYIRRDLAS